mmetsp:Transcript_27546/g.27769  ORF Transcript_27546/g.27769 Transcript_27546/m.27769 type:complete len:542 (+) Transcript_27546:110-1735(+)|eukprot:CAMPEP_0182427946 /NCGR_PEP_ID=MMETSP1167-20130531/20912_1 /TAXON_ID=2988 /ORGANISM="Mallomonas Sp, Strain CCMP3275" /LENGTH=541 /DNA_ID=CAMNT_0024610553 /DNA_START=65 /DNA_END=1690 /DNA_ORIENTATION=+
MADKRSNDEKPVISQSKKIKVEDEVSEKKRCPAVSDTHEFCVNAGRTGKYLSPILSSALANIGTTPMIRLNRIGKREGVRCEILAKCEFFNAGGSVKDRIGRRMIEDAEKSGRIKPGDTLIEPTSGNTGIGLALCAAVKGYRMIITLPEKMSQEKVDILKALGAEIIRTPTAAAWDSPDSHIGVARRLQEEIPNSHILDQYANPSNPLAHYDETANEIWEQCEGRIDMIVISVGTGGTITGIGRRLKELNPNIIIVGVDPVGSVLAEPSDLNQAGVKPYLVEGIGYDFIPDVLDRSLVSKWVKTEDKHSFLMARRLIREEALLCGGSSGAALVGALEACVGLTEGQRCVVLLPDSVRNYMSKFLSDAWMVENSFVDKMVHSGRRDKPQSWWADKRVADLYLNSPITISPDTTCSEAIDVISRHAFDMVPVQCREDGKVLGVLTEGNLTNLMTNNRIEPDDNVVSAMYKQFRQVQLSTSLFELATIFDKDSYALVVAEQRCFSRGETTTRSVVAGVVTRIDLLNFISKKSKELEETKTGSSK